MGICPRCGSWVDAGEPYCPECCYDGSGRTDNVNSVIICYLKGNANNAYLKMCELTDFLIQQFEENEDFRELQSIVRYTYVRNVRIQVNPNSKVYGVLCAFELEHKLYSM